MSKSNTETRVAHRHSFFLEGKTKKLYTMGIMNLSRVRQLNQGSFEKGTVVYWMDRDLRLRDNWALLFADALARKHHQPLVVVYNFVPNFLGGAERHVRFKMEALALLQSDALEKNISFFVLVDESGTETPKHIVDFCEQADAGALVTDFSPLKIQRKWKEQITKKINIPFFEVDAHNIVPAWQASPKQEFGAYTLRPKLHKKLPEFLEAFPVLQKQKISFHKKIKQQSLTPYKKIATQADDIFLKGGEEAAHTQLRIFLKEKLSLYARDRNDPLALAQSNLSAYLHYGMISAQAVVLETLRVSKFSLSQVTTPKKNNAASEIKTPGLKESVAAFLEELIIRRELADNFCLYNTNYDSVEGFPAWAEKTLNAHRKDKREYVYTKKQFEQALTHDELWNAAQREMVRTGKMHGYMRMYWAKKILEWTSSPEEAMKIAVFLNDTYELDGRDPNGYAGIAWSIGGVHDRAWFERPVYGQIRYMARSGCEKKFDVKKYIEKFS